MGKFNLTWNISSIQDNDNVTSQEASTKPKTGSTWSATGFTNYANPIATDKNTSTSPDLPDNNIHQFRVNSMCTTGGPIPNIGGAAEAINFVCIAPTITNTGITATATVNLANTSITKVRFTLKLVSDNSIKLSPTLVVKSVSNTASATASGLAYNTDYYWVIELYTTLRNNGIDTEVISSSSAYLGTDSCETTFTTSEAPTCAAVTSLLVTSVGQ